MRIACTLALVAFLVTASPGLAEMEWDYMDGVYWVLPTGEYRVNATVYNVPEYPGEDNIWGLKLGPLGWDALPPPGWRVDYKPGGTGTWFATKDWAVVEPGESLSGFMWTTDRITRCDYGLNTHVGGSFTPTLIPEPPWASMVAPGVVPLMAWARRRVR